MRGLLIVLLGAVSAAVASPPRVICRSSNSAELSGNVTLTCEFQANLEVLQITWQKKRGKESQNMVTCSEKYGTHITDRFKKHITVLYANSTESSILITKLEREDEGCYNCLFNAYPNGAFTGEVCLTDLKSVNEVFCIGQGNYRRIDLNPLEIRTRQSVQLIEKKIGAPNFFTVKGQYLDPNIHPTCEFWLEKESVQGDQNNPPEDTDEFVFTQCSASGNKKFVITWKNKGEPVSQEDKENTTGNLITVTSTLKHAVSSLPADHRIICTVTLGVEADPEKAALSAKEPTLGNVDKDDREIYEAQQQSPWVRSLMIPLGVVFLVVLILFLFYCKARKKTEAKTPKKLAKVENGQVTPMSCVKKLFEGANGRDSPKLSTEYEPGPASRMNDATPSDSDKRNTRESMNSSLKKRNKRDSARNNRAPRNLFPDDKTC
ncbi:uncharacterized protein LOC120928007 [Rana temporaria]|uniref:uncharacterized protein LOC120928007 n=1 Tax=Rana temporaria TaxID=8407 RepID=UPI001AAD55B2|nr:uncharacterized protein LOC120928007 [Rana temporaria]